MTQASFVIPFPDQSPSFINGVEFGRLLTKMEIGVPVVENNGYPIHLANAELLRAACLSMGYLPTFTPVDHAGYIAFKATKQKSSCN